MNIHQAKRIDRCKEITFALKRIGGEQSPPFSLLTLPNSKTPSSESNSPPPLTA